MFNKIRKITSLLLVAVLAVLFFAPAKVSAVAPGEDSYVGREVPLTLYL